MRTPLLFALVLSSVVACGKKKEEPPAAPAPTPAPTAGTGGTPGGGSSAPAPTPTAAGGEVKEVPKVTECPKSLAGGETVHRTITKECGRVPVTEDYYIDGGSLTLEAGSVLQFKADTSISVGYNAPGKLIVKGTAEAPVLFTSGADAAPGVWEGVYLRSGSDRSSVDGLVVEFAGQEGSQAVIVQGVDVVWKNSIVRDTKGGGMVVNEGGRILDFTGNTFDRIGAAPLAVEPEAVGGIGAGNKFPKDTAIDVTAGPIDQAIVWNPGAPLRVTGQVSIEGEKVKGTLELAPGTELRFGPEGRLTVGYNSAGSLKAVGTKEAPITFTTASAKEKASWPPLGVFDKGDATFDHAVFEYGGTEEKGVLAVSGKLSVKNSLFRENAAGLQLTDQAKLLGLEGNTFEKNSAYAVSAFPAQLGGFGANSYDARSRIRVGRGNVTDTQTWKAQGAVIELQDQVLVEGKNVLTIEAGSQFEVRDSVEFSVGYGDAASLRLMGTVDKPVVFAGVRHEPGAWKGIILYDNTRDCVFENVVVKDAIKGLDFRGPATGKISGMVCANCSEAAVSSACESKVEAKGIKADGGAAKAEVKPADCPK